ncbi:MAG: hypothetical protein ACJ8H8_08475 [Geminicoccaceae bacterium]
MLNERIAAGLEGLPVTMPAARVRAPHLLSLGFPQGVPDGLVERPAAEDVQVAPRLGRLRISPHVYIYEVDADAFIAGLRRCLR